MERSVGVVVRSCRSFLALTLIVSGDHASRCWVLKINPGEFHRYFHRDPGRVSRWQ
jgi:hypothetical protein